MKHVGWLALPLLTLFSVPSGAQETAAAPPKLDRAQVREMRERTMQAVEKMHADRRAAARPIEMYSPFYSVAGDDETVLYLLNNVADPVRFELAAINPRGEVLPLGEYEVAVTRHLTLPLRDVVRAAGRKFLQGSLRLSLLGDSYTLQAWTVVQRGGQFAEVQFRTRYKSPRNELAAVWGAPDSATARPVFHLINVGARPLTFQVEATGPQRQRTVSRRLDPGEGDRFAPAEGGAAGFVHIRHDGEPGDLRVAGLLEGTDHLSLIPIVRREDWEDTLIHEGIRLSWSPGVARSAVLTLLNVADAVRGTTIEVFDATTGNSLLRTTEQVAPGRPVTVDLTPRLATILGAGGRELRLRVATEEPGLLVTGTSRQADGTVDDLTLLQPQDAHASGSYPMLPLATHEVFLTLLNVGDEPSDVVAQFYWEGGTYSYGPVRVPAHGSYRLEVDDVVAQGRPDMLGQTLALDHPAGFLKWSARRGSNAIVGRTEARPRGGRDTFGFNCNACCGEWPWGVVIPESVEFFVGATPSFEAGYEISTCNGVMGPYPTSPTSFNTPAPFSWNGSNVGASSAAWDTATFYGNEQYAVEGGVCFYSSMNISGAGDPNACKTHLKKAHNPASSWSASATCTSQVAGEPANQKCTRCNACCNQILSYKICSRVAVLTANSEHQACLAHCATDICD